MTPNTSKITTAIKTWGLDDSILAAGLTGFALTSRTYTLDRVFDDLDRGSLIARIETHRYPRPAVPHLTIRVFERPDCLV